MPAPRTLDRIEIVGFPAPGQQARLLRVIRDSNSSGYELLPEGTDLTDCPFLNARDLEPYDADTYKLAKIQFDPQTNQHQWFFLNTRANEDAYNFETKYLDEASTKPVLTRTYVVPRASYVEVAGGTADPVHSSLQLIAQEQTRSDDPAVDALFVMVQRTYAALPGVVMDGAQYGDRISLPREFLAQLEIITEEQKVLPGTAADKGTGVIQSTIVPESKNVSIRKTEKVDPASLPKTVTAYETDRDGLLVTVEKTMAQGAQTITPSATVSGTVDPIGGGITLKEQKTLPEVFSEKAFSKEKPDLVPQQFRGAVPTETEEETVAGTAAEPTLAAGELAKTEQQVTKFTKRVRETKRDTTTLPTNLTETLVDNDGVLITRVRTLDDAPQTLTPSATVSGQIENLGDGLTVKTTDTKAEVFPGKAFSKEKPDLVPQQFRGAVPTETEEETVAGTAVEPTLAAGELAKTEQQVTKFTKRTRKTARDTTTLPTNLTETLVDNDGVLITRVRTLDDDPQTLTPSATVSGQIENLGDGLTVKTEDTKAEVFDGKAVTKAKPDAIPTKFKADIEQEETAETIAGTAADPTLASDEEQRTEQRVTKHTIRRTTRKKPAVADTVALSGKAKVTQFGGEIASTTETLKTTGTISGAVDFRTVSAQVTPIGDGRFVEEHVRADDAWPQLAGVEHDDVLGVDAPFTQQVVASGDTVAAGSDVVPIDKWRKQVRTMNDAAVRTALDGLKVIYASQERVALPDKLLSVQLYWNKSKSDGTNEGMTFFGESVSASCEAAVSGVAVPIIEEGYKGSVPAGVYVFFLPFADVATGDVAAAINTKWGYEDDDQVKPWPIIKPESVNVVIKNVNRSRRKTAKAVASATIRTETAGGTSVSFSVTRIPPTIHAAITPSGGTSETETGAVTGGYTDSITATATLASGNIAATVPAVFPVGKYLLTSEAAPFRAGYARVTALVVNITADYV